MAAGETIVRSLATVTGALPATIDRATREAQRASLAPIGRKGGGKGAAHWDYRHLVNVGMIAALATIGMPMTKAGETVPLFRALAPIQDHDDNSSQDDERKVLSNELRTRLIQDGVSESTKAGEAALPGSTLGEVLDRLVDVCGHEDGESLRQLLRDESCRLILGFKGRLPWARISFFAPQTGKIYSTAFMPDQFEFAELQAPVPGLHGAFEPSVTITFPLLIALAELWADTLAHRLKSGEERLAA